MTTNEYIYNFISDNIAAFTGVSLSPFIESEEAAYKGNKINMTAVVGDEKWEYNTDEGAENFLARAYVTIELFMYAQITKGDAAGGELREKVGVMVDTLASFFRALGAASVAKNTSTITGGNSVKAQIAGIALDEIYKAPDRLKNRAAVAAVGRIEIIFTEN